MSTATLDRDPVDQVWEAIRNLPNARGEGRTIVGGVSWEQYLEIDERRGADKSVPRFYFLDGDLEIMTLSAEHERIKIWIHDLLVLFISHHDIDASPRSQATLRRLEEAGAEPDESWCIGEESEYPDLVVEVALTSGGLDKLEIYRRLGVAEVWFWRRGALEIWVLDAEGARYDGPTITSRLLPAFDADLLVRCLALPSWREARIAFRDSLGK